MTRYTIDYGNTTATLPAESLFDAMLELFRDGFDTDAWEARQHELGRTIITIKNREAVAHCIE